MVLLALRRVLLSCFSSQTMYEIERIEALRKPVAVSRSVPVAAFEATDA